ncbi:MAG: cytochrome d ubiquinol oxidase subunit II [Ignavibacteriales bacterium]|nr:cytochrome d ubiquinol oxidase subunit II [Ignavibacteriales bacterium]
METLWFVIVAFMLAMYVILDGFDLGAGIIHLFAAKNQNERRTILNAIGPVWDGNEVWLLAAGGSLYFAFPKLYASSFSGFYLPLIIVLWLLILRALGIEFRHQVQNPLWKSFWDTSFSVGSILLSIFFGAALGNVVRGVPLNKDGYFFEPLWTTFTVVPEAGILDWFTVVMGLVGFFTLTSHGSNFIALKTEGDLQKRARSIAAMAWWGVLVGSIVAFISTWSIRPQIWQNYSDHPLGYVFPLLGMLGLVGMTVYNRSGKDTFAFLSSSLFIGGMLASTAFGLYPNVLPASTDPEYSLTIYNTAAQEYGLTVGLTWWLMGIMLATGYFVFVYRSFRGKVVLPAEESGY